jgi:hypothetical protein
MRSIARYVGYYALYMNGRYIAVISKGAEPYKGEYWVKDWRLCSTCGIAKTLADVHLE